MPFSKSPLHHVEPAHPGVIRLHDDLINIYKIIRENYQERINAAFDRVSRQIGFVVRTTLPVTLNVAGKESSVAVADENLRGTLFEDAFLKIVEDLPERFQGKVEARQYKVYLIWYDALKLKLHADWLEPAHVALRPGQTPIAQAGRRQTFGPGIHEPAHWFDASFSLEPEEALAISAIDEVYPELRLVERIRAARQTPHVGITPGVREPAHFRDLLERYDPQTLENVIEVLQAIQKQR
jgi:hypothetical protein